MGHAGYFTYVDGTPITEDGECTTKFRTRLNRGQAIGESLQKMWKSHSQHTDFNDDTTNKSASVACSNIRPWKSVRMTEDIDEWRKCVHGVATLGSRTAKEHNAVPTLFADQGKFGM